MLSNLHNKISVLNNIAPIIINDTQGNTPQDLQRTLENLFTLAYNTSFGIGVIGQHIGGLLNHILVHQFRDKLLTVDHPLIETQETEETQEIQQQHEADALKEHVVNNYKPICASSDNPDMPLYEPKTIVAFKNLKAYLKTQKQEDNILSQLNVLANLSHQGHGEHIDKYMVSRRITAKDCKKEKLPPILIGQNGVYATRNIPAFTVLGYYSGIYFTDIEEYAEYSNKNGLAFKAYAFSFPDVKLPRLSGYLHGNDLSLVNAATIYSGTAYTIARELYEKCNLTVVYAKSLEYPDPGYVNDPTKYDLVAYASNRDIQKGEQLYVNYGMHYWRNRNPNFTTATEDDITEQMQYFYEKTIKKQYNRIKK